MENINEAFEARIRSRMFAPVERHLTNGATREDRMQDALALTWQIYKRKAEQGVVLDDALLVHAWRCRAVDLNRHIVPADRRSSPKDVLDPRAYRDGRAEVCPIDDLGHAVLGSMNPEPSLNSALDLEGWLTELPERDRVLVMGRLAGKTLKELGSQVDMSFGGVAGRLKRLGAQLADRMGVCCPA